MKEFKYLIVAAVAGSIILAGCVKEKDFPVVPVITFKQYDSYTADSADCVITFKDGDGDIGIMPGDNTSKNDYQLKYLYKDTLDGLFKPFDEDPLDADMDTLFYGYRVPNLTPEGQYKALDGEIRAKLRAAPIYFPGHQIIKFEIRLRDRAGHLSNIVTTDEIVVP